MRKDLTLYVKKQKPWRTLLVLTSNTVNEGWESLFTTFYMYSSAICWGWWLNFSASEGLFPLCVTSPFSQGSTVCTCVFYGYINMYLLRKGVSFVSAACKWNFGAPALCHPEHRIAAWEQVFPTQVMELIAFFFFSCVFCGKTQGLCVSCLVLLF